MPIKKLVKRLQKVVLQKRKQIKPPLLRKLPLMLNRHKKKMQQRLKKPLLFRKSLSGI